MTHLAITGIGGFIGLRMAERALAMGWKVTGIDLSEQAAARARSIGAEAVVGDVTVPSSLVAALAGADKVFHTAAVVQEDGPRQLYDRVNNDGTRNVCEAARAAGVKRLVHLSSVMVYGFDYPQNITEEGPFQVAGNPYNETKLSSEQIALSFNAPEAGLGVIVIRPGDVYGMGSVPWVMRPLAMAKKKQLLLPASGGVINHVHVDNLIDGVLLAFEKDACGEAFNITDNQATPCPDFFAFHHAMLGKGKVPTLPTALLRPAIGAAAWLLPKLGIEAPAQTAGIDFLSRKSKVSIEKAQRLLGYAPAISLTEGMARLEVELREAGEL